MFDYIYADFVLFLNVHFATSTLLNELLVNIDQQKVGFILIFAAKIEKKAKYARTFLIFRYNRGERYCYIQDKVIHGKQQSHSQTIWKFTFFCIIIV